MEIEEEVLLRLVRKGLGTWGLGGEKYLHVWRGVLLSSSTSSVHPYLYLPASSGMRPLFLISARRKHSSARMGTGYTPGPKYRGVAHPGPPQGRRLRQQATARDNEKI